MIYGQYGVLSRTLHRFNVPNMLSIFKYFSDSERIKGIKLVLRIYENIIQNPSQIKKYNNLNAKRIHQILSKCKPAYNLLLISGFNKTKNNTRLIWENTNNNVIVMQHVYNKLQSIITAKTTTSSTSRSMTATNSDSSKETSFSAIPIHHTDGINSGNTYQASNTPAKSIRIVNCFIKDFLFLIYQILWHRVKSN